MKNAKNPKGAPKKIERKIKIIKEGGQNLIEEVMHEETVEKIKKALLKLPRKESIKEEDLDYYANSLCEVFQCFDHNAKKLSPKKIYEYLGEIEEALESAKNLIEKAPPEVRSLLVCANANIDKLPEVTESWFPDHYNLIKFSYLIGALKKNSDYMKEKTALLLNAKNKSAQLRKGKQENPLLPNITDQILYAYSDLTGKPSTITYSEDKARASGICHQFLKEIFEIAEIDASAENQIREHSKRQKAMELTA